MHGVMRRGPWNVDNHLVVLAPWTPPLINWDLIFKEVDFWIHFCRLPTYLYSEAIGLSLCQSLERCLQVQLREGKDEENKYF